VVNVAKNHSFSQALAYEILPNVHLIVRKTKGTTFCLCDVAEYHSFVPFDFTGPLGTVQTQN
jgi:hypothetical protein